jgi:hypothetical protein
MGDLLSLNAGSSHHLWIKKTDATLFKAAPVEAILYYFVINGSELAAGRLRGRPRVQTTNPLAAGPW